jgi:hypothetical protein
MSPKVMLAGWRFSNGLVLIKINFDKGRWCKIKGKNITQPTVSD